VVVKQVVIKLIVQTTLLLFMHVRIDFKLIDFV